MASPCAKLPSEIRHLICSSCSPKDLKNLRFANAPWGSVAASILFHTFESDLADTGNRELDAMLTSRAGGILDSIKVVKIKAPKTSAVEKQSRDILRLISVLPRDSLTQLRFKGSVEQDTLGLILRTQTHLQLLEIYVVSDGDYSAPPDASYVRGSLTRLKKLVIIAEDRTVDEYSSWLPHLPSLESLNVNAKGVSGTALYEGWRMPECIPTFNLRVLFLRKLRLPDSPKQIVSMMRLPRLDRLTVRACQNSEPLITMLAQEFAKAPSCLSNMEHTLEEHEGNLDHIRDLINSVTNLQEISVDAKEAKPLPVSCLARHGSSLRYLRLSFPQKVEAPLAQRHDEMYTVDALDKLIEVCPDLWFLGLGLVNIDFQTWASLEPLQISPLVTAKQESQHLAQVLKIIARLRKLQTLCLTHSPYLATGNNTGHRERQWRHAQLASNILWYLDKHGSPVRFLAFHPLGYLGTQGQTDSSGHSWPKYYYRKAKMVYEDDKERGSIGTSAVGVKKKDYEKLSIWHERLTHF